MDRGSNNLTEKTSIKLFAEYLKNLRAVNLYIFMNNCNIDDVPLLSVNSNTIELPRLGKFKVVLKELALQDCKNVSPRTLENNILCYRLVGQPDTGYGSAAAEVVSNFEKTLDEGAKNLVKNSINPIALKEGTLYRLQCRFCTDFISGEMKFDRIRPLPSNNWVENAHELWFCHPPEPGQTQGLQADVSSRLSNINLDENSANFAGNHSVVDLLRSPRVSYCFYGPCNWDLNKSLVSGVCRSSVSENCMGSVAKCVHCNNELGSFTSEECVKLWDYGVRWIEKQVDIDVESGTSPNPTDQDIETILERASQNFKSIVFATIYELSDHPTFRFIVSSVNKGNSVFLWNIDRNLCVYPQQTIPSDCKEAITLEQSKVAKFFFAVKENDLLSVSESKEALIIQESEQNEQNILVIPDYVYRAGIQALENTSTLYSREVGTLQCGYLKYDL